MTRDDLVQVFVGGGVSVALKSCYQQENLGNHYPDKIPDMCDHS